MIKTPGICFFVLVTAALILYVLIFVLRLRATRYGSAMCIQSLFSYQLLEECDQISCIISIGSTTSKDMNLFSWVLKYFTELPYEEVMGILKIGILSLIVWEVLLDMNAHGEFLMEKVQFIEVEDDGGIYKPL